MNSMVVFVSQPAECRDFNDGTMLSRMSVEKKIHHLDCIALDGGYTQYLPGIVEGSNQIKSSNFSCPVRKSRGIELTEEEKKYNEMLGGFRSKMESYFGEMQTTFNKFSHTVVNKVSEKSIFSLQFKLCCLLLNIKRMVALHNITVELHHSFWIQDEFEYPDGTETTIAPTPTTPGFTTKIDDARAIYRLQDSFLNLTMSTCSNTDNGHEMDNNTDYEIDRIMSHRGEGSEIEYHVLWKGYSISEATWEPLGSFNQTRIIDDYWNSKRTF